METDLAQKAISFALAGKWREAVEVNKKILKDNPKDIDSLNRLARAYAELGELTHARNYSKKVLLIDPFNQIAKKCLEKWKSIKKSENYPCVSSSGSAFIEQPGKTKIVTLLYTGAEKVLAKLDAGDEVVLNLQGHRASVVGADGKYVGRLPDDLGARLKHLTQMGNIYQLLVKSIEKKDIKIFIREVKCSPKLADLPSFPGERIEYISFTPPELVHKKEEIAQEAESEE